MLKSRVAAGLATSVAFATITLAPMMASAQGIAGPVSSQAHPVLKSGVAMKASAAGMPAMDKAAECSNEAKIRGLKGNPRKKFLAQCKRGLSAH